MQVTRTLSAPLFAEWSEQYVRLRVDDNLPATPLALAVNGTPTPFQPTGHAGEILVRLAFTKGETKELVFTPAARNATDLRAEALSLERPQRIGTPPAELTIPAATPAAAGAGIAGPFTAFAGFPFTSFIHCTQPFERATLTRMNDGPLFTDYRLRYEFAEHRQYTLQFRCYKLDPYIEVSEHFALQMDAAWVWTLNPADRFDSILSRDSFEGESQPTIEPINRERPGDVLCRLQMPVLTEYFIPNNRGWFALFDTRQEAAGLVGIVGLYGARWVEPIAGMPEVRVAAGRAEWHASLASGERHWLLYAGPVESQFTPVRRLVFHRLHAEFNALRLDEHFDLAGDQVFDESCWREPGLFVGADFRPQAQRRAAALPCVKQALAPPEPAGPPGLHRLTLAALLAPTPATRQALAESLRLRFEKWVRQFQGWRTGEPDYLKNVIGFSRWLRGMLIAYELLRKDEALTDQDVRRLNAHFVFAARRILDEGRWPHSKTWKHPDHPESTRDFYRYGGEHVPDRLVWTNCLPNFQSDPLCALAHLSALFKDHPQSAEWRQFAVDEIERQLDAYCGPSGAWEESINYALYTFGYFVITFRLLKHRWGIDYFQDERVRRLAGWLCRYFGPYDRRFEAYTWPGVGNAVHPVQGGAYLLAYASELAPDDPLRHDCIAVSQFQAPVMQVSENYPTVLAAMAPITERRYTPRPTGSEVMAEVGVSLREKHLQPDESYLFQKIGFAKDHYENDESAFNWYAKGAPFCLDYGTYTGDVAVGGAHNLVEIPDMDSLRRGYLAGHYFSPIVDYIHCEIPVTLKLLWGRVRSFDEVDGKDDRIDRTQTPYFYIGDKNPVGPKTWKVRLLLFVKPDYVVLFDRVFGEVPHRYNLHFTGDDVRREGNLITARGRYDLDLLAYVHHPSEFDFATGELIPNYNPAGLPDEKLKHRQSFFRLYNRRDSIYRTVLFAQERGRHVAVETFGTYGVKVVTDEYTDYVFVKDQVVDEQCEGVRFVGRAGWIRRETSGRIKACVPDGELIEAFGKQIDGRGPWSFNMDGKETVEFKGVPRKIQVR